MLPKAFGFIQASMLYFVVKSSVVIFYEPIIIRAVKSQNVARRRYVGCKFILMNKYKVAIHPSRLSRDRFLGRRIDPGFKPN
jgi:hypothetical protein